MKYAVIRTGGKQYKVAEGQIIEVERLIAEPNSSITFSDVLLIAGESTPVVGSPVVAGATVVGKVLGEIKGEKLRIAKYKAKVRYRRVTGHRQLLTKVQIETIASKAAKKDEVKTEDVVAKKATKKAVK